MKYRENIGELYIQIASSAKVDRLRIRQSDITARTRLSTHRLFKSRLLVCAVVISA